MAKRLLSIDFMRGIAVVAMIEVHVWGAYIAEPLQQPGEIIHALGAIPGENAAELFALVSGASASLLVNTYRSRGSTGRAIRQFMLARGAFLFLLATAISFVSGPLLHVNVNPTLNWSVIQLIGFCLLLAPEFDRSPWPLRALWVLLPWVLFDLIYPRFPILAPLCTGVAPVFPWSSLFFAGMWISDYFFAQGMDSSWRRRSVLMGGAGILLVIPVTRALSIFLHEAPKWRHGNQLNFSIFTMLVGTFMILLVLSNYLLDQNTGLPNKVRKVAAVVAELGQRSLSIYYIQLLGVVLSAVLIERFLGVTVKLHWVWFLPLLVFTLAGIYWLVNVIWKRHDYLLSIEWIMARLVRKPSRRPV